jgi:competence protein ComEA
MHVTPAARFALVCLLGLGAAVALARRLEQTYVPAAPSGRPVAQAAPTRTGEGDALRDGRPLDVNRASAAELALLPGVGPRLAGAILEARAQRGPFRGMADLGRVKGIGPKTLAKLAPLLRFGSEQLEHAAGAQPELADAADDAGVRHEAGAHVEPQRPAPGQQVVETE